MQYGWSSGHQSPAVVLLPPATRSREREREMCFYLSDRWPFRATDFFTVKIYLLHICFRRDMEYIMRTRPWMARASRYLACEVEGPVVPIKITLLRPSGQKIRADDE